MSATYCVTDCETGGVDERINPLLSVALLIGDEKFDPVDGFSMKILPPENTHLEVPILEHQKVPFTKTEEMPGAWYKRTIQHWINIHSGDIVRAKPETGFIITAVAADICGFTQPTPNGWDMAVTHRWLKQSFTAEEAENAYIAFLNQHFKSKPIGVAHMAIFDVKYVAHYLPRLRAYYYDLPEQTKKANKELSSGWYCTCTALKGWNKRSPTPGENAKLTTLAKLAGYVPHATHEALADCYSCLYGLRWLRTNQTALSGPIEPPVLLNAPTTPPVEPLLSGGLSLPAVAPVAASGISLL